MLRKGQWGGEGGERKVFGFSRRVDFDHHHSSSSACAPARKVPIQKAIEEREGEERRFWIDPTEPPSSRVKRCDRGGVTTLNIFSLIPVVSAPS